MHYVGIDLRKRYVSACALDKSGEVVAERRRLSNTAEAILTWLSELEGPVAVALEGDAALGLAARSAERSRLRGGGGAPAAGEADLSGAL